MVRSLPLLAVLSLALLACNGPKGSPEGTLKSYYSAANGKDWPTMAAMLTPDSLHVTGGEGRAAAFLQSNLDACSKLDVDVGEAVITKDGATASAPVTCQCRQIWEDRKEHWVHCDQVYQLKKQPDGNWYITLPAATPLKTRM